MGSTDASTRRLSCGLGNGFHKTISPDPKIGLPGSRVSMDDLREFLVDQAAEYDGGTACQPYRMGKDCERARKWIEGLERHYPVASDDSKRTASCRETIRAMKEADATYEGVVAGPSRGHQSVRDSEYDSYRDLSPDLGTRSSITVANHIDKVPTVTGELSHIGILGEVGDTSLMATNNQKETSVPYLTAPALQSLMPITDDTMIYTRSRFTASSLPRDNDTTREKSINVMPSTEDLGTLQAVTNRIIQATVDSLSDANTREKQCSDKIKETRLSATSQAMCEAKEGLQLATQKRDEAQEDLDTKQIKANAIALYAKSQGDNRTDKVRAVYDRALSRCDSAKAKRDLAQKTLENIEAKTRGLVNELDQALNTTTTLEAELRKHQKTINKTMNTKTVLFSIRNCLDVLSSECLGDIPIDQLKNWETRTLEGLEKLVQIHSVPAA
ncbi:hypothetical protein FHETE_5331 [Fusarium heterosporum]|uniref:Uncharacterized protein n=1 Tax=Fusarium heterosporum TaxID=42747 RepID=A0A8H5TA07_FUSHE|nr:hypothetical protein FHETE_5331 [Fusarium heterosporum]